MRPIILSSIVRCPYLRVQGLLICINWKADFELYMSITPGSPLTVVYHGISWETGYPGKQDAHVVFAACILLWQCLTLKLWLPIVVGKYLSYDTHNFKAVWTIPMSMGCGESTDQYDFKAV